MIDGCSIASLQGRSPVVYDANRHLFKNKFDLLKVYSSNTAIRYFGPRRTSTILRDATLPNKLLKCRWFESKMGIWHFPFVFQSSCSRYAFLNVIIPVAHFVVTLRLEAVGGGTPGCAGPPSWGCQGSGGPPPRKCWKIFVPLKPVERRMFMMNFSIISLGLSLNRWLRYSHKSKVVSVFNRLRITPWRLMGECRYSSNILKLDTKWRWVAIFTPRPLCPWGNRPRHPLCRRLGGLQIRSGFYGGKKNFLPLLGINPRTSIP
jgi:hypothetical protein